MAETIGVRVEGLRELQAALDRAKGPQAQRVLARGLRAGAEVFQAAIEERAPVRPALPSSTALPPGALRGDIEIHTLRTAEPGGAAVTVGPGKYTAHVARWVEFGHRLVRGGQSKLLPSGKTRGRGVHAGAVPPHPFLRPAFEAAQREALAAAEASIRAGVANLPHAEGAE